MLTRLLLLLFFAVKLPESTYAQSGCPRDVSDSMETGSLQKCKESIRTVGQTQSQKLATKTGPVTENDEAIKSILDLPQKLAECVFRTEGLITGEATYTLKKDAFVDKADLKVVVKSCRLSTAGVCPFKDILKSETRLYCLPHPVPFLKCVRQAALKPCSGSVIVSETKPAVAATTSKPKDNAADVGPGDVNVIEGMVEGDDKAEEEPAAPAKPAAPAAPTKPAAPGAPTKPAAPAKPDAETDTPPAAEAGGEVAEEVAGE